MLTSTLWPGREQRGESSPPPPSTYPASGRYLLSPVMAIYRSHHHLHPLPIQHQVGTVPTQSSHGDPPGVITTSILYLSSIRYLPTQSSHGHPPESSPLPPSTYPASGTYKVQSSTLSKLFRPCTSTSSIFNAFI
jgi:hypothetical protein